MTTPSMQQLTYLVALADCGSFSIAADTCFVSQPALSAQIKELENRLGLQLVERTPRGILLTQQGAQAVSRARAILRDVNDLVDEAKNNGDELRGEIHLSAIPTMAPYLLPSLVQTIKSAYPNVQLHLHEDQTNELLQLLRSGKIDIGLLAMPIKDDAFSTATLAFDPFLIALPENHALADTKAPITLNRLAKEKVILLEDGHCLRSQAENMSIRSNIKASDIQATSLPTLIQMVAAGMGVTLLPQSAASVEARKGSGVVTRPIRSSEAGRTNGLVWRSSSPVGKYLARVIAKLTK